MRMRVLQRSNMEPVRPAPVSLIAGDTDTDAWCPTWYAAERVKFNIFPQTNNAIKHRQYWTLDDDDMLPTRTVFVFFPRPDTASLHYETQSYPSISFNDRQLASVKPHY